MCLLNVQDFIFTLIVGKLLCSILLIGHVRYINILTWLRGFRLKIVNFLSFFCLSIPKRDLDTKKTTPNIEVWPESLGATLEYWYIRRGLLFRGQRFPREYLEDRRPLESQVRQMQCLPYRWVMFALRAVSCTSVLSSPLGLSKINCMDYQLLMEEWVIQTMKYQYLKGRFRKQNGIFMKAEEGLPTSDFWLLTSDFWLPTSDFQLPTSNFRLRTLKSKGSIFNVQLISLEIESNLIKSESRHHSLIKN